MHDIPPVCLLLRYFTIGGLERVVSALANSLAARGADVRIVVLSSGKRNALITELDPRIDLALLSGTWPQRMSALRELTAGRLVHIQFGDGYTHPLVRAALSGRPVVVTYQSVYTHKRNWLTNRIDQFWASRASGIVAVSEAVRRFCVDEVGIHQERVVVIPNGIALDPAPPDISKQAAAENGSFTVISLASLYPHKNQKTVIDALAIARGKGSDIRLRVIGDGPTMASLYQQAMSLGIQPAVDWYGAVWRRDMVQPLVASAQAFVSASRFEGLPLSVLEGMAFGLPMVLSDIQPHHEVTGDDALYFSPDDPAALAGHLDTLLTNPKLRAELGAASLERVRGFDFEPRVDQYIEVYQRAAAR